MKNFKKIMGLILCVALMSSCSQGATDKKADDKAKSSTEATQSTESVETSKPSTSVESTDAKKEVSSEVSLSDWEDVHPKWNSITTFYTEDYLVAAAEKQAKEESKTADELLKEHEEGAHSDIASIEFSGNKITLLDKDGKELASSEYKYVRTIGEGIDHGEFAVFEAVGDVAEQYKALAIMQPHGGEGDITHFHLRYAKSTDDAELENNDWWPVFVDPDSTEEQVINEILGSEE